MGRPPRLSAAEVCKIIALHPEPVVTSGDVHETMDMTQRGARERLERLVEEGYLHRKKVGSSGVVYYLSDQGRATLAQET